MEYQEPFSVTLGMTSHAFPAHESVAHSLISVRHTSQLFSPAESRILRCDSTHGGGADEYSV
jgi:putative component of membrane protein insertase Oxa1/YidC/SpoIIIJ protein YidD